MISEREATKRRYKEVNGVYEIKDFVKNSSDRVVRILYRLLTILNRWLGLTMKQEFLLAQLKYEKQKRGLK